MFVILSHICCISVGPSVERRKALFWIEVREASMGEQACHCPWEEVWQRGGAGEGIP
jgi:hypothetical protein